MRGRMMVLAAVVWTAVLAGCNAGPADEWTGLTHPTVLSKAGLKYYWHTKAPVPPGQSIKKIIRLDENVYCLTDQHLLIALDAATGNYKWSAEVASATDTVFDPVHASNVSLTELPTGIREILSPTTVKPMPPFDAVMVNTLSYVVIINRNDGKIVRGKDDIKFDFAANTRGATDGSNYYAGGYDGIYHSIRLQAGVVAWKLASSDEGSGIVAPLEFYSGRVFVANESGRLCATSVGRRPTTPDWIQQLLAPIRAAMHVDDRGIFVPSWDGRIYAFDHATGTKRWEPFICGGVLQTPIQVGERCIFQYANGDKFYAIDLATGRGLWTMPQGRQVLAVMDGDAYIRDAGNQLMVVDEMLGTAKATLPMLGVKLFAASAFSPAIYAATTDGRIFCITTEGTRQLMDKDLRR